MEAKKDDGKTTLGGGDGILIEEKKNESKVPFQGSDSKSNDKADELEVPTSTTINTKSINDVKENRVWSLDDDLDDDDDENVVRNNDKENNNNMGSGALDDEPDPLDLFMAAEVEPVMAALEADNDLIKQNKPQSSLMIGGGLSQARRMADEYDQEDESDEDEEDDEAWKKQALAVCVTTFDHIIEFQMLP